MKVLWFTNTPSNYTYNTEKYNGGGWLSSAESAISKAEGIELAVSFVLNGEPQKVKKGEVTYYPIRISETKIGKVLNIVRGNSVRSELGKWDEYKNVLKNVVDDFKPDIIQVWGTEGFFGLVSQVTTIPVIIHLQGIINPIMNSFLPPFVNWRDYNTEWPLFSLHGISSRLFSNKERRIWESFAYRERVITGSVKYYFGRTTWDKRVISILNPNSKYYHCEECLRDVFYEEKKREIPEKLTIVSTISAAPYKGFDVILKTAKMLSDNLALDFEWKVFGNVDPRIIENRCGICCSDVNVSIMGVASATQIRDALLKATCYVHLSYSDNSPNSISEAQILGVPCIATNIGGIPSLINDGKSGYLVPANDPYQVAYLIEKTYREQDNSIQIGMEAQRVAKLRHDKNSVVRTILSVYEEISKENTL